MFGVETDRRTIARLEREARLATFIKENRPVNAVALLEGINHDYAYKLLMRVSKARGLDYRPKRQSHPGQVEIPGLTGASQTIRARMGDMLYSLEGGSAEIARRIGIPVKAQPVARDRPFNYDWSLSQMERLAQASGTDLRSVLLEVLTSGQLEKVKAA